jgi:CTP-dependent riboflavin kinase
VRAITPAQNLTGYVTTGQGDLAHWMTLYADAYEAATGQRLVPGSLNVVLSYEWTLPDDVPVRLEPELVGVGMSLVPCRFEGLEAFIARTDRNDAGTGGHSRRVIEIVSSVHLRRALRLVWTMATR